MAASEAPRRAAANVLRRAACAAALLALAALAGAGEIGYTAAAFDRALTSGSPTIVHFRAPWCPTCRAQKPVVDALLQEPARKDIQLFAADFDTETALKQRLRVVHQSTFVVFKGGKEVARSTAETRKEAIAALFDKAL